MLVFGFMPELFAEREYPLFDGSLVMPYVPLWPLLIGLAIGLGAAAAGLLYAATQPDAPRHYAVMAWVAGVGGASVPLLLLALARSWQTVPAAALVLASAVVLVACLHVKRRGPAPWVGMLYAGLVAAAWVPLVALNASVGRVLANADDVPPSDAADAALSTMPLHSVVLGLSVAYVGVMVTAGVAQAAHARSAVAHEVAGRQSGWWVAAIACAVAAVVVVIEMTGFGGLSSGYAEPYWQAGAPLTWVHAAAVALAIAYVAQRSWRRPLAQRGDVAATVAVGVSALSLHVIVGLVTVVSLVAGAVTGTLSSIPDEQAFALGAVILWLALLLTLIPMAVRPAMRDTIGQWMARIGLLFLVPMFVSVTARLLWDRELPFSFWAKPTQVVVCLTVIGCLATIVGAVRKTSPLSPAVVTRLVVIPLLIVAGTMWLPTVISAPLTPVIAVTAALFALLWAMPPAASDPNRHGGVVLLASAQLLLVSVAAAVVGGREDWAMSEDPLFSVLLLSIPLSTLLCASVVGSDDDGRVPNEPTGSAPPRTAPTPASPP